MYLIHSSSALSILLAVNSLSVFLLFLMQLINRFTYAVTLKHFLMEEYLVSSISKGFLIFTYFRQVQSLNPRRLNVSLPFLQWQIQGLLQLPFCSIVATCLDHARAVQYHITTVCYFLIPSLTFLVCISAGLCFVFMYRNATSVSLMISMIRFLTKAEVFSLFLIHCCTHWESVRNIFSAFSSFIALATKHRLLAPVSTDISSSLGMVSFFFSAFLALEKTWL